MPAQRKVFRIEQMGPAARLSHRSGDGARSPSPTDDDVRVELRALRALFEQHRGGAAGLRSRESGELDRLRWETDAIHHAIRRTMDELAALRVNGLTGRDDNRVARELDAVMVGSEQATQQILTAAEEVDQAANMLSAAAKDAQQQGLAQDIQDQVVRIFEACNFQDVSGQRITKVLGTLKFVEERIAQMMTIWDEVDACKLNVVPAVAPSEAGAVPVNGPRLEGELGHVTQAEIDAMFA